MSCISFNSSVGILSVGTDTRNIFKTHLPLVSIPQSEFCPLGRGWGRVISKHDGFVSIPQSEFCPLGQLGGKVFRFRNFDVSIPQSEFCPLGP